MFHASPTPRLQARGGGLGVGPKRNALNPKRARTELADPAHDARLNPRGASTLCEAHFTDLFAITAIALVALQRGKISQACDQGGGVMLQHSTAASARIA